MSKRLPVVWPADPHTIAKIAILRGYLNAWFRILGMTCRDKTILYVDGFAGPGYYKNHDEGSPLAALRAASDTIASLGQEFIARELHCAFIERDRERFKVLCEATAPYDAKPRAGLTRKNCDFVAGIAEIRKEIPGPFRGDGSLFVFADPFGGTDTPFDALKSCMNGETSELLINLDADGVARIFLAPNNNRDAQLTALFGDESWRHQLTAIDNSKLLSVQILDLYKQRLLSVPGVRFVWSFAMRGSKDMINYHLVFATRHPLGMEKMKEAMRAIDKTGAYSFSDAHTEQHVLFRADDAEVYAEHLFQRFDGKTIAPEEARVFALCDTPFSTAKPMLAVLDKQHRLKVETYGNVPRRAGTFPEDKVRALRFGNFGVKDAQGSFNF